MACNEGKTFKNKAPECEKLDCWCFPEPYIERKVKVRNKKHCWLYPERETKELVKLIPNFEHCKTLYTKCDYRLENYVSKQLLLIEDLIHKHKNKLDNEIVFQRSLIEQMWKLSQRFLLLTQFHLCVKPFPEIVSVPVEKETQCEFQKKFNAVNISNCRLSSSLDAFRFAIKKLNLLCSQLDMTVESPFIIGDYKIQPLSYYRNLIDDAFDYFNDVLCKLKCWAQLLDIGDANALDEYKALLDPTMKYDEFMKIGKLGCTCMRTKNPECIDNVVNKC
ncbi:uncharacterized protein LOC118733726 [Rhagoletis pomonella]|uniref:uncharacterized protein LOC118733726 n=1 Tax=Rhagoletis pomonella TaxID=28610 RepID=UPI00177B70AE|nr:uncharacterized protein LOC118733726 [Rhagoletis pomonella]